MLQKTDLGPKCRQTKRKKMYIFQTIFTLEIYLHHGIQNTLERYFEKFLQETPNQ